VVSLGLMSVSAKTGQFDLSAGQMLSPACPCPCHNRVPPAARTQKPHQSSRGRVNLDCVIPLPPSLSGAHPSHRVGLRGASPGPARWSRLSGVAPWAGAFRLGGRPALGWARSLREAQATCLPGRTSMVANPVMFPLGRSSRGTMPLAMGTSLALAISSSCRRSDYNWSAIYRRLQNSPL
jgi:hypothetical protein